MDNLKIITLINEIKILMDNEKERSIEYKDKEWTHGYHTGKYLAYETILDLLLKERNGEINGWLSN